MRNDQRGEGRGDMRNERRGEGRRDARYGQGCGEGRRDTGYERRSGDREDVRYGQGRDKMNNEARRGGDGQKMRGAARRTYPVAGEGAQFYRGNGERGGHGGPRVGAVYANVPAAQRVDAEGASHSAPAQDSPARTRRAPVQGERREFSGAAGCEPAGARERFAADVVPVEENENLLVGRNPIREALRAGRPVEKLLVAQGDLSGAARDIIRMAREAGAVVQQVDRSRLDQIYPAHQGMLAYVAAVEYRCMDEVFDCAAQRGEDPFLVVLDGVTDPHNLGAIIRSAECAGVHGVIVPERRAAGLGPAAAKAAAGALNYMRIVRVKNLNRAIEELKERGVWVIGTAMDGEDALRADLTGPVALVIGSEGEGISRLTLEKCDRTLTLPMKGSIESLNASVAAGVLMYEIVRARAK